MSEPEPEPEALPALVLERWNSWVKLYFPSSEGTGWINLGETDYEVMDGPPPDFGGPQALPHG